MITCEIDLAPDIKEFLDLNHLDYSNVKIDWNEEEERLIIKEMLKNEDY